jgi:hypothetical protein
MFPPCPVPTVSFQTLLPAAPQTDLRSELEPLNVDEVEEVLPLSASVPSPIFYSHTLCSRTPNYSMLKA